MDADVLPLRPPKRRRIHSRSSDSDDPDHEEHYRSIEGKAKPSSLSTYDAVLEVEQAPTEQSETRRKGIELSRLVEKEPQNGRAWLDLIDHQDVEQAERQIGTVPTLAERHSLAEIKMSIASKALRKVQTPHYRELLITRSMEEAARTTDDTAQLHTKWRETLEDNPRMVKLWFPYLNFLQRKFSAFHFEELREAFTQCLDALKRTSAAEQEGSLIKIYLLLRMTTCIREAGFVEQAVAIWQVLLEFNFLRPANAASAEAMKSFEVFWESETPRIGEKDARGWAAYTTGNASKQPEADGEIAVVEQPTSVEARSWFTLESQMAAHARIPARSLDDSGEDPYRVVLFSDIKDYLVDVLPRDRGLLVYAFLAFCWLPSLQSAPSEVQSWWHDPFIISSQQVSSHSESPVSNGVQRSEDGLSGDFEEPVEDRIFGFRCAKFAVSQDTLFADSQDVCGLSVNWIIQALRTLVDNHIEGDDLAETLLALELRYSPATVRKTAKTLLKRRPSSLRLYAAYALIEYRLGNVTAGDKVLATATEMSSGAPTCVLLWRTWILEAIFAGKPNEVLARVLAMANPTEADHQGTGTDQSPAEIFQAQKRLIASRDDCLLKHEYDLALMYTECLVALSYLSNNTPLEAALSVFNSGLAVLPSSSPGALRSRELLHQSCARLCFHHATTQRHYRPSLIRNFLASCLERFPNNTIFLSLFAWNEARFRVDDRVRAVVRTQLQGSKLDGGGRQQSRVLLLFDIHVELRRAISLGSNVHSIRNAFERAVQSDEVKHSIALWKWYYDFETGRGELKRAKDVYYRAIRVCPWAKELYALPFRDLTSMMSIDELHGCYELMVDKELRLHVRLDKT